MSETTEPIIIEESYDRPIETVWKAITEPAQMKKWFFEPIENFEPVVGFETEFEVTNEGRVFPHLWKLTEVEAPKRIVYDWSYRGYEGKALVTFELSEVDGGTTLRLTHEGWQTFPQVIPEFTREAGAAGWTYFLKESLKGYLGGGG